jgi:hypothetical protein
MEPPVQGGRVKKHAPPREREADEIRNRSEKPVIAPPVLDQRHGGNSPAPPVESRGHHFFPKQRLKEPRLARL